MKSKKKKRGKKKRKEIFFSWKEGKIKKINSASSTNISRNLITALSSSYDSAFKRGQIARGMQNKNIKNIKKRE